MESFFALRTISRPFLVVMVAFTAAAFSIILVAAFYHFIVMHYYRRRQENARWPPPNASDRLEQKILQTIPIVAYSAEKPEFFDQQSECAVCLADLEEGAMVRVLPNCMHGFHVKCIDEWFLGNSSCPICRTSVTSASSPALPTFLQPREVRVEVMAQGVRAQDRVQESEAAVNEIRIHVDNAPSGAAMLRHCSSLDLDKERRLRLPIAELKRSLSLDHRYLVIDFQKENQGTRTSPSSSPPPPPPSSSPSPAKNGSAGRSDLVSSKQWRSFSRLIIRESGLRDRNLLAC
ncbi:RING-H2 finger protein ATL5-like [Diospyros lotus]|uniref:RING-H2 finger protein ATL5-like n=1 Tax=Diospyros lotus TaxID=55363 RepID=UPI002252BBC8|nr:RING-H2 finger protein ATL5-like [Diospyros lotus]